jgi:hypothetical protein
MYISSIANGPFKFGFWSLNVDSQKLNKKTYINQGIAPSLGGRNQINQTSHTVTKYYYSHHYLNFKLYTDSQTN